MKSTHKDENKVIGFIRIIESRASKGVGSQERDTTEWLLSRGLHSSTGFRELVPYPLLAKV